MTILYFLIVLTGICLFIALKSKRFILLVVPVLTMVLYFIVQIILVPGPVSETIAFIFSLR